MKKTTKRRQNGGGAGASVPSKHKSKGDFLCVQAIKEIKAIKGMRSRMSEDSIIQLLHQIEELDKGYISNDRCIDPETEASLLILASKKGYVKIVNHLIEKKVDINFTTKMGNTALHVASINGRKEVVKILLDNHSCMKDMFNIKGYTPLEFAISSDADLETKIEIINEFRRNAINMNARTKFGYGLLHVAAANNKHEIIPFLIENGADINSKTDDKFENTPLIIACILGYSEVVKVILSTGTADPNIASKDGWTSIYYAAQGGFTDIVKELLDNGANPNIDSVFPGAGGVAYINGHKDTANLIWKETDKSIEDINNIIESIKGKKNNKNSQEIISQNSIENYDYNPNGNKDYDYAGDNGYRLNFEEAADKKPGGSKRAYPPRKTRRQSKRRRRQNKK